MKIKLIGLAIIAVLVLILLTGLTNLKLATLNSTPPNQLQVTASFYPMYYFAAQVGGSRTQVLNITPAGSEPHDYEPTVEQIAQIKHSQLLIMNGGNLEAWANKVAQDLNANQTRTVVAGQGLTNRTLVTEANTPIDPHVWLSPKLAQQEVNAILTGYVAVDPSHQTEYQTNAAQLQTQLTQLDQDFTQGLSHCQQNSFVTSHEAFGYLARDYHLDQIAIAGISPDEEPSAKDLAQLTETVKQKQIHYIFFESLISPKLSQTLAQETGAQTLVLDPLEGITTDQLQQGANYFTVMHQNLHNLQIALSCT